VASRVPTDIYQLPKSFGFGLALTEPIPDDQKMRAQQMQLQQQLLEQQRQQKELEQKQAQQKLQRQLEKKQRREKKRERQRQQQQEAKLEEMKLKEDELRFFKLDGDASKLGQEHPSLFEELQPKQTGQGHKQITQEQKPQNSQQDLPKSKEKPKGPKKPQNSQQDPSPKRQRPKEKTQPTTTGQPKQQEPQRPQKSQAQNTSKVSERASQLQKEQQERYVPPHKQRQDPQCKILQPPTVQRAHSAPQRQVQDQRNWRVEKEQRESQEAHQNSVQDLPYGDQFNEGRRGQTFHYNYKPPKEGRGFGSRSYPSYENQEGLGHSDRHRPQPQPGMPCQEVYYQDQPKRAKKRLNFGGEDEEQDRSSSDRSSPPASSPTPPSFPKDSFKSRSYPSYEKLDNIAFINGQFSPSQSPAPSPTSSPSKPPRSQFWRHEQDGAFYHAYGQDPLNLHEYDGSTAGTMNALWSSFEMTDGSSSDLLPAGLFADNSSPSKGRLPLFTNFSHPEQRAHQTTTGATATGSEGDLSIYRPTSQPPVHYSIFGQLSTSSGSSRGHLK
jgi:hypothetical protein